MDGGGSQERNDVAKLTQMKLKSKVNRLKRSPKSATQHPAAEFKTPTRPARAPFRKAKPDDSPSNDPEFHHDIIWDTTSPSPVRHGRGHRRAANVRFVDISDLATRIAPKNGRVEGADSSLLQWIGDSAIPCTPEVQQSKVKTVSAKQNTVEDLMRLAKQFDYNMRQDEALEPHLDGLGFKCSVDQELDNFNNTTKTLHNGFAVKSDPVAIESINKEPNEEKALHQEMDDDLDFLFDGPTQQLSGRFSQMSGRTQDVSEGVKNLPVVIACNSERSSSAAPCDNDKQVDNAVDIMDDWNSDSFFEDSLVLEMTQNPDLFAAPRSCSTQKQNGGDLSSNTHSNGIAPKPQEAKNCVPGQNVKRRQTFQLETFHSVYKAQTNPNRGLQRAGNHMEVNYTSQAIATDKASTLSSSKQYQNKSEKRIVQNSSFPNVSSMCFQSNATETAIGPCITQPPHSKPASTHLILNPGGVKSKVEDAIIVQEDLNNILDEDLDLFFASDDIWDEGIEDDDLFCEACDNLEVSGNLQPSKTQPKAPRTSVSLNKITGTARKQTVFAHPNPPINVSMSSSNTSSPLYRPKTHAVNSGPVGFSVNASNEMARPSGPSSNEPYKFTPVGCSTMVRTQQGHIRGVLATLQSDGRMPDSQKFQKSYISSSRSAPAINKAAVRCSDAEIERKKQEAMERRRLRMMSNQNLRALF